MCAQSANIELGSVTDSIDKLIKKRGVKRSPSETDSRIIYAELTKKGLTVIKAWEEHIALVAKDIMSNLYVNEQEALLTYMERMLADENR